jgi:hypothetical protein
MSENQELYFFNFSSKRNFHNYFFFLGRFHFFTTRNEWKDKALMNGVLRTTTVESVLQCGMNCLNTPQCISFNIEYIKKKQRICELNKKKDVASPSFRKGLQYFEIIKAGY